MKKMFSIFLLVILIFFVFQWGVNFFKTGHEINYQISFENSIFNIEEKFQDNYYDIVIKYDNKEFYYNVSNYFNKQKKIIKNIELYAEDDDVCIYPILENKEGTYIQCIKDGIHYTNSSFPNQDFIAKIKNNLASKKYIIDKDIDTNTVESLGNTSIYKNNLLESDIITLWDYKGIQVMKFNNFSIRSALSFDKYENNHGYLVDKFYVIPKYLSSKVLEFSEVTIIDIENLQYDTVKLGYTLSSDTYINGVIDHKLYYTDPSNLLQVEVNPNKKSSRLIGSADIGGQFYNGEWQDRNIYDFKNTIVFQEKIPEEITKNFSYINIVEGNMNYYFYNQNGEVYQIPKEHYDKSIFLFKAGNLNNFKVVDDTIYYVVDNTTYYYQTNTGIVPILKNNELRYNTKNRINIERRKS